jgi:hypothetical protein
LPLFFDGIREKEEPYRFLAVRGVEDLLKAWYLPSLMLALLCWFKICRHFAFHLGQWPQDL